jgi:DNA-binding transcriptional ArsR family regulator
VRGRVHNNNVAILSIELAYLKNISKFVLTVSFGLPNEMKEAEKAFDALGDPTRRLIFEKLRNKPMAVGDIADGLEVSRPAVSQHIRVLKDARLIRVTKRGTRSICQIDPDGIMAMRFYLDDLWSTALSSFKELAEEEQRKKM